MMSNTYLMNLRRRLFNTTLTLEKAMSAEAHIGVICHERPNRYADDIVDERPEEILTDHTHRALRETDGIGDTTEVSSHECHLGYFHGDVRTLAHGDAHIGSSQSLRVVDTVAHHRHVLA